MSTASMIARPRSGKEAEAACSQDDLCQNGYMLIRGITQKIEAWHFNFDEPGALYAKDWISERMGPIVPVTYIRGEEL